MGGDGVPTSGCTKGWRGCVDGKGRRTNGLMTFGTCSWRLSAPSPDKSVDPSLMSKLINSLIERGSQTITMALVSLTVWSPNAIERYICD